MTVNVGRAGAASMNIIQEVEFVKTEAKIPYILRCLDKTPPPVLIFAERKQVSLSLKFRMNNFRGKSESSKSSCLFLKYGPIPFPFLISTSIIQNEKSIDGVLEI